jgi:hypothetical protein
VLGTVGDENTALTLVTFRIAMGPNGSLVTMARACLYLLDEQKGFIFRAVISCRGEKNRAE